MRFQDLSERDCIGRKKRFGAHWRGWLRSIRLEFSAPARSSPGFSFAINEGDDHHNWQIHVSFLLLSFWLTWRAHQFAIGTLVTCYWDKEDPSRKFFSHETREFSLSFHDKAFWLLVWGDPMGGWSRDMPWWQKTRSLQIDDLALGRMRHEHRICGEWADVLIPMPEGCYPARMRFEEREWRRPLWPWWPSRILHQYTEIEIPKGVPFDGKGENSYDCGEDGLFGCSSRGWSYEAATGHVVTSVLESRRRYGWSRGRSLKPSMARQ